MKINNINENIIVGRNSVNEAIRSNRTIDYILVGNGNISGSILPIISKAKDKGIVIKECNPKKLDYMSQNAPHQGIIAVVAAYKYSELDDIFSFAKSKNESPFIVMAENIEDPHNLGAIIRSAECAGAHGIIIPKRRSSGLTYVVSKASAGAIEYIPIVRVTNIVSTIGKLKDMGVWVFGADMAGETWCQTSFSGPVSLVIGNEGYGLSKLVKEKCDNIVSLPLNGSISSLNASVAAGILMYEISRQKHHIESINDWT